MLSLGGDLNPSHLDYEPGVCEDANPFHRRMFGKTNPRYAQMRSRGPHGLGLATYFLATSCGRIRLRQWNNQRTRRRWGGWGKRITMCMPSLVSGADGDLAPPLRRVSFTLTPESQGIDGSVTCWDEHRLLITLQGHAVINRRHRTIIMNTW